MATSNSTVSAGGKLSQDRGRGWGQHISDKDLALFTRQLATMMTAGVPLLQSFDIVGKGHARPALARLVSAMRADLASGTSLRQAFGKYPRYFTPLFCDLVGAGEQAGVLDQLLTRLANDQEKTLALRSRVRSALMYPLAILVVAVLVTTVILVWVVPAFEQVFASVGARLPAPTLLVMALSAFVVAWWHLIGASVGAALGLALHRWRHSPALRQRVQRWLLGLPLIGQLLRKAAIARWSRTLATLFAAGLPLIESLDAVGAAAGNVVYLDATRVLQAELRTGNSLTAALHNAAVFPYLVTQLVSIGEQTGALDAMLSKVADYYEAEVEQAAASLSSLLEPAIMLVLGLLIGGLVFALYLPIFTLGAVV